MTAHHVNADVAAVECRADVVADHVADALAAVVLLDEVAGERGSGHLRNMLVLGDGEHFLFGQATKCNAIVDADHG